MRNESVPVRRQGIHHTWLNRHIILSCLLAEAPQEFLAADTLEAGIVVTVGDEARTAFSAIDHAKGSAVSRKVDRGGQAGGTPANDETVKHRWVQRASHNKRH